VLQQIAEEYQGFRQPGIRLSEPLVPSIASHRSELLLARLYAIHLFDKAHITMLTEEGLISLEHGVANLRALREMEAQGVEKVRLEVGGGMHSGEQYLIRKLGEDVGGRIHLGRSSGDLGAVSTRIYIRDNLLATMEAVNRLRRVLIDLAQKHIETVMPGYTHGQHAQPTTLGHYLLSWVSALERDFDRLHLVFEHTNQSPAGAAIMTGADFALNRERVAEFLGFAGVERNTIDAILAYDSLFEAASALAILYMNLARWADDFMLWSTSEFGMIDVPDRYCGTSSIMMQKKNVYLTQWIKGAASDAVGGLMTTLMVDKAPTGLPIIEHQYSRDAVTRTFDNLKRDLGLLAEMLPDLQVNEALMLERAGAYWAQATDVAGMLVREYDLAWRTAHQIVGILVRLSYERGIPPKEVTPELLDEASVLYMGKPIGVTAEQLASALDPAACVERRTLYGGPAPSAVKARLPEYEEALSGDERVVSEAQAQVQRGLAKLEQAIDALIARAGGAQE
jgi:argininosuccinate lyase